VPAARLTEPDPLKDAELRPVTVGVIAIEVPAAFFRVADAEVIVVKRAPPDAPPEKAYATEAVVAPAGIVIEPDGAEIETAGAAAWATLKVLDAEAVPPAMPFESVALRVYVPTPSAGRVPVLAMLAVPVPVNVAANPATAVPAGDGELPVTSAALSLTIVR